MAAAPFLFGHMHKYCPDNELFSAYMERVKPFFTVNGDKKVAVFLTVIGSKTYSLLRKLVAPTLPQEKLLEQLVTILKQHYEPRPLVIAERFFSPA
jgi:hypothetical protein